MKGLLLRIFVACLAIAAISCSSDEPSSVALSRARSNYYRTLELDTEGRVRKITPMFQVALDSMGTKTKVFDGFLIQYTYTVNDTTIKGKDRTRYSDYPMANSERAVDSMMRGLNKVIVRYDKSDPRKSLLNLERTFNIQE